MNDKWSKWTTGAGVVFVVVLVRAFPRHWLTWVGVAIVGSIFVLAAIGAVKQLVERRQRHK